MFFTGLCFSLNIFLRVIINYDKNIRDGKKNKRSKSSSNRFDNLRRLFPPPNDESKLTFNNITFISSHGEAIMCIVTKRSHNVFFK